MTIKRLFRFALAALVAMPFAAVAQQALPYSYGFESADEFNSWTTQSMNTENAAALARTSAQHRTGSYSFQFSSQTTASSSNYNQYLISPEIMCPSGMHLTFYYRKVVGYMNESFRVGYSSTTADVSSFMWLAFTNTTGYSGTPWENYEINLPAGTKYVAINYNGYNGNSSKGLYIDDINMTAQASCMPVTDPMVIAATQNSITLSWTDANNDGASYMVFDMSDTSLIASNISDTSYTVNGLEPNTVYTFGVVADCGGGEYSTRVWVMGRTECGIVGDDEMPWSDNFNSYESVSLNDIPCYMGLNYGYSGNAAYPGVGTTVGVGGGNSKAMVFKCRGTIQYEVAILPQFESLSDKSVVFNVKDNGVYNYSTMETEYHGVLEVGVMTDPSDQTTFTSLQTYSGLNATWVEKTVDLSDYPGNGTYIAFRCHNTMANTSSSEDNVYVDNVFVLVTPTCPRLVSVTVDSVTGNDAVVHITDTAVASHSSYRITFIPADGDEPIVYDGVDVLNYAVDGLSPNTSYTVTAEAECADGTFTAAVTTSIITGCGMIPEGDMPWSENFDNVLGTVGQIPCWTVLNASASYPYAATAYHHGASGKALLWNGTTNQNTVCVMPEFETPMNQLIVNLWFRTTTSTDGIQLGYVTDPNNANSFVALANYVGTVYAYSASGWSNVELTVPTVPATATNLAIKFIGSGNNVAVDDIVVSKAPNCPRPTAIVVSNITNTSAEIHVVDSNTSPNYTVLVYSDSSTVIDNVTYTTTNIPLTGLDANTVYSIKIVANCGDGGSYSGDSVKFRTQCAGIAASDLPWSEGFDTYPGASSSLETQYALNIPCWTVACRYSSYYPMINSARHYNGINSLYVYGTAAEPTVFALPWFTTNLSDLQLTFALRRENTGDKIEVGVMSNPMDTNTFTLVQTCSPTSTNTWQLFNVTFTGYTTGNIAFRGTTQIYIDSIAVSAVSSCTSPVITLSDTTNEGVTVHLSDANNIEHYMLYLDGSATGIEVFGDSYTITDLLPGTVHTLIARTMCSGGGMSSESPEVTFSTLCEVVSALPWSENFSSWATGDSVYNPCWVMTTDANHLYPYAENVNGNKMLYYYASSGAYDACYSMAKLPVFSHSVNSLSMSFRFKVDNNAELSNIVVGVAGDGDDTVGFTRIAVFTPVNTNWHEYDVDFSSYTGTSNRIAVMLTVGGSNRAAFGYLDEVEVDTIGTCPRPDPISVTHISADSAVVSWGSAPTTGTFIVSWGEDDQATVNDVTSYTLTDLAPNTEYTVTVRRDCGFMSRPRVTTFHTHAIAATLPYNTGFEATNDTAWNYMQADNNRWYIGTATSHVGARSLYVSSNGGATDSYVSDETRTFAYRVLSLTEEGDYDISFDWKAAGEPVTIDDDYLRVYLAPEDAAPNAGMATIPDSWMTLTDPLSEETDWQSIYTVGSIETPGNYLLIFCWKVDALTVNNPAVAVDNVSVSVQSCTPPTDLTYGIATATSISFTWTAVGGEQAWDVSIDNGPWQRVAETSYTANGLTSDADHEIAVRAVCGEGDYSFAITGTMHTGTLGIYDTESNGVSISPNPATGAVSIRAEGMQQAALIDLNGRTVLTATLRDGNATIDVSSLARGAYFVRLTGEQYTAVRKLIVK